MSDVVLVALFGFIATIASAVIAPLVKASVDRRSTEHATNRREIAEVLKESIGTLQSMRSMVRSAAWLEAHQRVIVQSTRLGLIVRKGEGEVPQMLAMVATVYAWKADDVATESINQTLVDFAAAILSRWFRGERDARGLNQELADYGHLMRSGIADGSIVPGGFVPPENMASNS